MTLAVKEGYNRAPVPAVAKVSRRHGVFGGNPMFENLTDRLGSSLKNLAGQGSLTEDNIRDTLREVRKALLEACLLYTSPSPRDRQKSRMPSSA